jgi:putative GTP pyrophosphokinase
MLTIEQQVRQYEDVRPTYKGFAERIEHLIGDLIANTSITAHLIESRVKTISSFREKLSRDGKSYRDGVAEMPDLCGCRIITYYQDDCVKIGDLLRSEFLVLEEELSHQQHNLQADRFGYLSAHYVVAQRHDRMQLAEWKRFDGLRAEIQVRTVIQHAWSAVSHALQYKAEAEVPSQLQRRLYRIAGLFELADEEFEAIRDQRKELRAIASEALASGDKSIGLTIASVEEYLKGWRRRAELENVATMSGFEFMSEEDSDQLGDLYDLASRSEIKTVQELDDVLENADFSILRDVYEGQREKAQWSVQIGFLISILLIAAFSEKVEVDYLIHRGWSKTIAEDLVASVQKRTLKM